MLNASKNPETFNLNKTKEYLPFRQRKLKGAQCISAMEVWFNTYTFALSLTPISRESRDPPRYETSCFNVLEVN